MSEFTKLFERAGARYETPDMSTHALLRRLDRKRRNQRIAAAVVGIVVFVAAIAVVTTVGSLDRSETSVVPGGSGTTGPAETGSTFTQPGTGGHLEPGESFGSTGPEIGPVPATDYLLDLDTGQMTPLPKSFSGDQQNHYTAWYAASPDGSRLAYTARGDDATDQIFIANLDGTGVEQVTRDLDAASQPAWSPDGSKIAYIGEHDDRLRDLFVVDLATGGSTQLTFAPDLNPWEFSRPSFTPDGSSIVYGAESLAANAGWDGNGEGFEMRMVPVAGGESVRLRGGLYPELSPDGTLVSYAWPEPVGHSCVCVSNLDGTGERVLVQGVMDAINGTPWSPDGTRIAYYTFHSQDVSIVDVATGQTTHVAEGHDPTWLDDRHDRAPRRGC